MQATARGRFGFKSGILGAPCLTFFVRCGRWCTFREPISFWKEERPVRFDHGFHRFARIESCIRRFLSVCIRAIRGRDGLWWHEDRPESTEPAAGANDEERGHVAVPGRASVARSSSWLSLSFGEVRKRVMKVMCPHCQRAFDEAYYKTGMPAQCPSCEIWFPLKHEQISERGDTGDQITCDDFRQLLRESMSPEDVETYVTGPVQRYSAVRPICAVRDAEKGWDFCSPDRKDWFDAGVLHMVIQTFSSPQQAIYQYAMSKWR